MPWFVKTLCWQQAGTIQGVGRDLPVCLGTTAYLMRPFWFGLNRPPSERRQGASSKRGAMQLGAARGTHAA